jgi:hypothetical protein
VSAGSLILGKWDGVQIKTARATLPCMHGKTLQQECASVGRSTAFTLSARPCCRLLLFVVEKCMPAVLLLVAAYSTVFLGGI